MNSPGSPHPGSSRGSVCKERTAIVLIVFGIILAFTALLLPPPGEIHESVLYIFAQILIYCGSIFGIDSYINQKINNNNIHSRHYDKRNKKQVERVHQHRPHRHHRHPFRPGLLGGLTHQP